MEGALQEEGSVLQRTKHRGKALRNDKREDLH